MSARHVLRDVNRVRHGVRQFREHESPLDPTTRQSARRGCGAIALVALVAMVPAIKGCTDGVTDFSGGDSDPRTDTEGQRPADTAPDHTVLPGPTTTAEVLPLPCSQVSDFRSPTSSELDMAGLIITITGGEQIADFACDRQDIGYVGPVNGAPGLECGFIDSDTAVCHKPTS